MKLPEQPAVSDAEILNKYTDVYGYTGVVLELFNAGILTEHTDMYIDKQEESWGYLE